MATKARDIMSTDVQSIDESATALDAAPTASPDGAPAPAEERPKVRAIVYLIVGALLILAIVAALAFSGDSSSAAPLGTGPVAGLLVGAT